MRVDCKRDDNLVKTQRTSVGSSEASPQTGGLYPDREGKDNAPLSLLCLPSLSPLTVTSLIHFPTTFLQPSLFPVLPGHLMWSYLIRKIILIVALFSLSVIWPLHWYQNPRTGPCRTEAWGHLFIYIYLPTKSLLYPVIDKICDNVCVCSYNSILSCYPMGAKWYVYKQCKSSSCRIDLTSSVSRYFIAHGF